MVGHKLQHPRQRYPPCTCWLDIKPLLNRKNDDLAEKKEATKRRIIINAKRNAWEKFITNLNPKKEKKNYGPWAWQAYGQCNPSYPTPAPESLT
jgi:hypothetical protein